MKILLLFLLIHRFTDTTAEVQFLWNLKSFSKMTGYNVQNRKVILGGKYERIF